MWRLLTKRTGFQFAQWIDREKASGWLAAGQRILAQGPGTPAERAQRTAALWSALGQFTRALDLPLPVLFPYVRAMQPRGPVAVSLPSIWRADWVRVARAASTDTAEHVDAGHPIDISIVPRLWLRADGTLQPDRTTVTEAPDPPAGQDTRFPNADTWAGWAWVEWFPSWASASDTGQASVLVPLSRYWEVARLSFEKIASDGIDLTVEKSRIYAAAVNLSEAERLGVELPEEIVRAAAEARAARAGTDAEILAFGSALGGAVGGTAILGAAALSTVGLIGALLGMWLSIPFVLQAIFGRAIGSSVDWFGRRQPVFELTAISGSFEPAQAPSHLVEDPPASTWFVPLVIPNPGPEVEVLPVIPEGEGDSTPPRRRSSGGGLALVAAVLAAAYLATDD